jgi:hypothetical protein
VGEHPELQLTIKITQTLNPKMHIEHTLKNKGEPTFINMPKEELHPQVSNFWFLHKIWTKHQVGEKYVCLPYQST